MALKEPGILKKFCGKIRLCAVPAEELLEIEYRTQLKKQGIIKYFGGKSEFLSRGYFDGVDIAFMVHTSSNFSVQKGALGCLAKSITYKGVATHAGVEPWNGKNAFYAANCGINAINAIPETATLESYVRGASFDAIKKANQKVNQALCGAALSIGTNVEICDTSGYAPLVNDKNMIALLEKASRIAVPEYEFSVCDEISSGSTDMGDLSSVMPVVHPYAGGATGRAHGNDYEIADPIAACVGSAKLQLGMLYLLLADEGKEAYKILKEYEPAFASKNEYFEYIKDLNCFGDRIEYSEGNVVKVNIK